MNRPFALLLVLAVPALAAPPATPSKPTRKQVLVPGTGPRRSRPWCAPPT